MALMKWLRGRKALYASFSLCLLLFGAGCTKAAYYGPPAPEPPARPAAEPLLLLSVTPSDGSTDVAEDVVIEFRFSLPPDPETVNPSTVRLVDESTETQVDSSLSPVTEEAGSAAVLFRLTPARLLELPLHPYRVEFSKDIRTPGGTKIDFSRSPVTPPVRFTTRSIVDTDPPRFFYYDAHAEPAGPTSIKLKWFPAIDNAGGSPPGRLSYAVYTGSDPDSINLDQPAALTLPGATEYVLGGLEPNTTYYFVIHAVDEAGNEDRNHYVISARTFLASESTELTILYSADVFGTLEPCG